MEENSRLRTLADAVSGPGGSDFGSGGNGVCVSSDSGGILKGFDMNKLSEDAGGIGGSGVLTGLDGKIEETDGFTVPTEGAGDENENDDGGDGYMEEHGFCVGELVWGKVKSHPWWPGQIYDSKDASEYASKFNQKGRLLVAYFGDGSFAWCLPNQLIPFAQHFEEMSNLSSSKNFVNAVQEAVDEIGRLVEMEMTCQCVPEENRKGLDNPPSANAGIKAGVLVPEGDIGKILSFRYDSAELLATVENIAESVCFGNLLELAILKSWLSAFYRAKGGGYSLPVCREGLYIEGLEDKNRSVVMDRNGFSLPTEVPVQGPREEDWSSAANGGPDNGFAPSEDKVYHRRKQKSVAELMGEVTDMKSKSRKKKRMVNEETGIQSDGVQDSATGRKRDGKKNDEMAKEGNICVQVEEKIHQESLSDEWKEGETDGADDNASEGTKETDDITSPRERKKSKYLSPPYTNSRFRAGKSSSKKQGENESERISKIAKVGERMSKAAEILLDLPPAAKCNGQTVQENFSIKGNEIGQLDSSVDINLPRSKQDEEKIIDIMDVNGHPNKVLEGVVHLAVNPLHSWDENLLVLVRGFISTFRSSIYLNGANYKIYHKRKPGRKRKSSSSEQRNLENGNTKSPDAKDSQRSVGKKIDQDNSDMSKRKKGAGGSVVKSNDKKDQVKASSASLVVTFSPGISLPSKDDVIRIFSKFGVLNEKETAVLHDSGSVQIAYTSSSGAEEALRASLRQSPFSTNVNYKLCYHSNAPVAVESSHNAAPFEETLDKHVGSRGAAANKQSQLGSVRRKLKSMTSMLEKCDGKISLEDAANLDGEIKQLLKKVRKMTESASY